ncbi:hypothetical protein ACQK5W_10695 [Pantoea sp. FN060301]|uniref:hypothetical protein n=1 Tax=Pantoea sp. FN060301 TaxID=3420380 RepID=UPI003D183B92
MGRAALVANIDESVKTFTQIHLVHVRVDAVEKMTFSEFQQAWRKMRKNNDNPALRYFNRQNDDFKFCVMTLANRERPTTFRQDEIGRPFESFTETQREMIIVAMNKMCRWGRIILCQFSVADSFLSE